MLDTHTSIYLGMTYHVPFSVVPCFFILCSGDFIQYFNSLSRPTITVSGPDHHFELHVLWLVGGVDDMGIVRPDVMQGDLTTYEGCVRKLSVNDRTMVLTETSESPLLWACSSSYHRCENGDKGLRYERYAKMVRFYRWPNITVERREVKRPLLSFDSFQPSDI